MQPGKLRHFLTIQKYTSARTAGGEATRTWATHKEVWGQIQQVPGRELINASDSIEGRAAHQVKIRAEDSNGIAVNMRISWNDDGTTRLFNIIRPPMADLTNERYRIVPCEEIAADG